MDKEIEVFMKKVLKNEELSVLKEIIEDRGSLKSEEKENVQN